MSLWILLALAGCSAPPPEPPVVVEEQPAQPRARKAKAKAPAAQPALMVKPAEQHEKWAAARCNDGTPFGMAVQPAPASRTWLIQISGGFFCEDDKIACSGRKKRLTTTPAPSHGAPAKVGRAGLFARNQPLFAGTNLVRAYYCSSDLWLGESTERQATTGSPEGWYFSGRTNFRAALEVLIAHHGLDEAHPDSRLLLVGYSAGGAGVVGNLDTVLELLPTMAAEHRVKVVLDGSWIAPADPALLPDADRWGPAHKACASELEAQGIDPVQCIFGPRWWPHAAATGLDFLVQISGMDVTQTPVWKVESKEELLAWSEGVAASLEPLPWVFSRGRPYHTLTFDDAFALPSPKGTYGAVLRRFWEGAPPEQVLFDYGL